MVEAAEVGSTANKYEILARLATGGMAEIFLARGVSTTGVERYCVLKRILRNRASDVSFVRMFLDEAKLAAQLQHPNIAQVYDIGKLGDSYFFTMEYVHGETVRQIMQRARSLRREVPLASVLTVIAGAAAGLHHAHDRIGIDGRPLHIVHRDVSPSNLMVSYEGSVKVVDFGVAKAADRATETRSGTVKGKISYLSPEQARGSSSIDRRSDLFALGIVFWEMLAMERLYKRASDFENMTAIVTEPTPPPSSRKKGIPPELDAIALKLLAKDPKDRYQTAEDLIEALERFAGRSGTIISASALSRFLREMFGQRPEPWIELDTVEAPEGVTVTSEPIPGEIGIPVDADGDVMLDQVPRLTRDERPVPQIHDEFPEQPGNLPTPVTFATGRPLPEDQPTTPHPRIDPLVTTMRDPSPPPPRGGLPPASSLGAAALVPPSRPSPAVNKTIAGVGSGPSQPKLVTVGSQASGPHRAPFTATDSSAVIATSASVPNATPLDAPRSRMGWQLVTVIALAAVLGSGTMWFVMKNRSSKPAIAPQQDAAIAVADPPPEPDAAVIEEEPVVVDAAIAMVEIDAAPAPEPIEIEPPRPPSPPPKKKETDPALDNVINACKQKNEARARALFAKLPKSKRKAALDKCDAYDLDKPEKKPPDKKPPPEKKPPDKIDPCEADPMSCQH